MLTLLFGFLAVAALMCSRGVRIGVLKGIFDCISALLALDDILLLILDVINVLLITFRAPHEAFFSSNMDWMSDFFL